MDASERFAAEWNYAAVQEDKRLDQLPDVRRAHQPIDWPAAVTSRYPHHAALV